MAEPRSRSPSRPLHVVHVGNYPRAEVAGGMEVLSETLGQELGRLGVRNTLLSFSLRAPSEGGTGITAPGFEQRLVPCARKAFEVPVPTARGRRMMREAIREADVVHLYYPSPLGAYLGARMARAAEKPTALSIMSQIGMDTSSAHRGRLYRAAAWGVNRGPLRYAADHADVIFSPSPGYLAANPHIARHERRAILLPLGADLTRFRPDLPRDHVRRKHGIPDGVPIVLFLGSLKTTHRGKGLDVLMAACAKLQHEGIDHRLVVAADGELEDEFMALAASLGIRDRVVHAKGVPRDEVPLYFAGSSVFVLASTWLEAFGLVLAEAMACETPVIGSTVGGIPYVIGDAGLTVPPKDADALAGALRTILTELDSARELAKRGRARVEQMFTWPTTARIALDAFERIARR